MQEQEEVEGEEDIEKEGGSLFSKYYKLSDCFFIYILQAGSL